MFDPVALKTIVTFAEGDMRRAINTLQAAASVGKKVDEQSIYQVIGKAGIKDVTELLELAMSNKFIQARDKLRRMLIEYGISGQDILRQIHSEIFRMNMPERRRIEIAEAIGEIDYRISQGADEEVQLSALLAHIASISVVKER